MSAYKVEFPPDIRAKTDISMLMVSVLATIATVLIFMAIYPFKGTFIRDLMMGRNEMNAERIIFQGLTTWMWMMSTMNVVLKFIKLGGEKRAMKWDPIPINMDLKDTNALIKTYERLSAHPKLTKRLSLMRPARLLAMWINTEDFERTAQYTKEENELDIYASDSSYRANRLFIWAMPLLGFVGTVYGVSYGIGGFADFLRGNVTAEEIKYQVGLITEGLAVAFYCTLLGLMTAGIAAFPSLAAERKEEGVLEHLDQYCQNRLLSRMPSVRKTEFPVDHIVAMRQGIENIKINVEFPMDDLSRAIEEGFSRLPDPDRYEQVFSRAIAGASNLVTQKYEEFARSYEHRITELGTQLAGQLANIGDGFNSGASQLAQQLGEQAHQFALTAQQQSTDFSETHVKYLAALHAMNQDEVASWDKAGSAFKQVAEDLGEKFVQALSHLDEGASQYLDKMNAQTQELAVQLAKIAEIGGQINELMQISKGMETALTKIGSSEQFADMLASLQHHLTASDALLSRLSKPRRVVLQETVGDHNA